MSRRFVVSVFIVLTFIPGGPAFEARATQPEDPAQFESDPLMGGEKWVVTSFKLTPKWDRVRRIILDQTTIKDEDLAAWVAWAEGLKAMSATERLLAINTRVNEDFRYASDQKVWGEKDHWNDPVEAVAKQRIDCEDYAIFKMFLAHAAGIPDEDLAIAVGKIPSTGEHHAILFAADGRATYVLDNRSRYLKDTDTQGDFQVLYSVDFNDVWLYPAAFKKPK